MPAIELVKIEDPDKKGDFLLVNVDDFHANQKRPQKERWKEFEDPKPDDKPPTT